MKILIAFEKSGRVRDAFRAVGHDAWSCDLQPCEADPTWHIQGDAFDAIGNGAHWDILIAHPPCDYLTVSGNAWFSDTVKASPGVLTGEARREARREAVKMVELIWDCGIPQIAIENPIGRLSTLWMPPTQVIQPTQFGEPFRKATCLWLKGLPPLQPTHVPGGDLFLPAEPVGVQAVWREPPGPNRKANRSRTYSGVANAMAAQWGA